MEEDVYEPEAAPDKEEGIYAEEGMEELEEGDEISPVEEAFMAGYAGADKPEKKIKAAKEEEPPKKKSKKKKK